MRCAHLRSNAKPSATVQAHRRRDGPLRLAAVKNQQQARIGAVARLIAKLKEQKVLHPPDKAASTGVLHSPVARPGVFKARPNVGAAMAANRADEEGLQIG
jgi:hypothetical protein